MGKACKCIHGDRVIQVMVINNSIFYKSTGGGFKLEIFNILSIETETLGC